MAQGRAQVWTDIAQVPADFGPAVVTIGNFDGVHLGHQEVLRQVVDLAKSARARAVAVTFDPHPSAIHRPETAQPLLTQTAKKIELIAESGVDAILVLPYSLEFAQQSAEEFVSRYIAGRVGAKRVVVGHDVRFGWQNSGDLTTLIELGREHGFEVTPIADLGQATTADDRPTRWSSTVVRELLLMGDVSRAQEVLGREHSLSSRVIHGDARGRLLGFPTANLEFPVAGMIPADGVYAGWLERINPQAGLEAGPLPAAISIGTNPTFAGVTRRVEAYVLDRTDLELYGDQVRLRFVDLLRPTLRFDSVDELVKQMTADVDRARQILVPDSVRQAPKQPEA